MRRPTRNPFHRPAMQTLERLYAELGGQILENKQEAQRLAGQMLHVEAVIKMLDPTYNLRRISVKRRTADPWFKRGTICRRAVDVLRMATEPMTARDVAERVLVRPIKRDPTTTRWRTLRGRFWPALGITSERVYNGPMRAHRRRWRL